MRNYSAGMRSQQGTVNSIAEDMYNGVKSRLNMYNSATGWGANIVNGMVSGIERNIYKLGNAASKAVGRVQSTVTSKLEIMSPSRWSERQFAYLMQGAVNGVERNEDSLLAAITDAIDRAQTVMRIAAPDAQMTIAAEYLTPAYAGAAASGTVAGNTTNLGGVTVNVYAAEGQDANSIANMVMRKMQLAVNQKRQVFG